MKKYKDDGEWLSEIRTKLFSAAIGDVLDQMGYLHQFLPQNLKPLDDDMVVVGRAMPVLEADCFEAKEFPSQHPLADQPFGLMFQALDSLKPNDVYLCAGGSSRYAVWGELMSTRARILGAAGAVCAGFCRDSKGILELGFPTFSYGTFAQDQGPRGKVVDYNVPIEIGGLRIRPGELIVGDRDGVLFVPKEAEEEAIRRALEKVSIESQVRKAIENGMSTVDAFNTFGVM